MTGCVVLELDASDELHRAGLGAWYADALEAIHYRHGVQMRGDNLPTNEDLEAIYRHHGVTLTANVKTGAEQDPQWWSDAFAGIARERAALGQLWMADLRGYGAALAESLQRVAAERGMTVEVKLTDLWGDTPPCELENAELYERARWITPLPSSGLAPQDYPPGICPVDIDRAAGRSYLARLAARGFAAANRATAADAPIQLQVDPGHELFAAGVYLHHDEIEAIEAQHHGAAGWTGSAEQQAALERDLDAVGQLWEADRLAYGAAFAESLQRAAAAWGMTVEVEVVSVVSDDGPDGALAYRDLYETARATTPLPASGIAPQDYPPGSCPGDVDRAAGRSYLARLAAVGTPSRKDA